MKVVYFGSDVFLSCFEYFVEKHQVLALYTYHNDEDYFTEYAIVKRAGELGIPVHYEAISPEEIRRYFTEEGCELFFIAEYDRILTLPEELPAFRGINTHSSLLPQGRSYYRLCSSVRRLSARSLRKTASASEMFWVRAAASISSQDKKAIAQSSAFSSGSSTFKQVTFRMPGISASCCSSGWGM